MGTSTKCISISILLVVVAVISITLIVKSLKKLSSDEVGIKYNTIQKTLDGEPKLEGLYTGPPGYEFIIFPNTFTTMAFHNLACLNSDGVDIRLHVQYQYKAHTSSMKKIILEFKTFTIYKDVLSDIGEAALHEACSHFNTTQFQTERGAFQEFLRKTLHDRYSILHCSVTDLQVNNIARPAAYEAAIRSKERAREDIKVAKSEEPRRLTEADTEILQAETQGKIIMNKAESDARIRHNKATAEAEAIRAEFQKEGEAYAFLLNSNGLGLTQEGFISYLGSRVIAAAKQPVYISLGTPAKTSYVANP
ncbi:uncharacterized protein LOC126807712 [Patella vulgata]|uniref:uncharacterized protein LOC126807712 n=1 Tax=Patella vulgata TaxID=6465 RepID=UPI0021803B84|nr:uncharacterized protein LOC126807712 [Patella vulgata]XP_050388437.1 uncharacterized protein LOC126807712 [Patella vulgata]